MQCAHDPLYDVDPPTGVSIEVFYARRLASWAVRYELRGVSARDGHGVGLFLMVRFNR